MSIGYSRVVTAARYKIDTQHLSECLATSNEIHSRLVIVGMPWCCLQESVSGNLAKADNAIVAVDLGLREYIEHTRPLRVLEERLGYADQGLKEKLEYVAGKLKGF
jgi:hypothetical protein